MNGSTAIQAPPAPAGAARAAGGGAGTAPGSAAVRGPGTSGAPVPVLPPHYQGAGMPGRWPLRDFIELGALPGAVPCARLHARLLLWEWQLSGLSGEVELLISEVLTNAIQASRALPPAPPVRLWLLADERRVLILVWDASHRAPVLRQASGDAENGRGLLLVEMISAQWGWYIPAGIGGKVVWALTEI